MVVSIAVLSVVVAYLVGSISSAIIVCHLMGLPDPRTSGSKNPGATNVLRLGGKKAAIITLLGDVLKGFLPVLIVRLYTDSSSVLAAVTLVAFLGHVFPVLFRFQGGKGVATAFGGMVALSWPTALATIVSWILVAMIFRYSSLSALVAACLAPIYIGYFTAVPIYIGMSSLISSLIVWRHRSNIRSLLAGTERKIGQKG